MLDMNENRRILDRRKNPRRTHDLLQGVVPEVDLQQYDMQLYGGQLCGGKIDMDRRAQERRSGEDRRAA